MSKRNKILFNKPEEPAFIKRMKEKIGYKEGPTVDTKKEVLDRSVDDRDDADEEKPTIVVLKKGDLTEDEVSAIQKEIEETPESGAMVFRKPDKKVLEEKREAMLSKSALSKLKSKRSRESDDNEDGASKRQQSEPITKPKSKPQLLSFGEDEEDE